MLGQCLLLEPDFGDQRVNGQLFRRPVRAYQRLTGHTGLQFVQPVTNSTSLLKYGDQVRLLGEVEDGADVPPEGLTGLVEPCRGTGDGWGYLGQLGPFPALSGPALAMHKYA